MIVYGIWTFAAAVLAFLISAVTGKYLIPFLHKINFGQTIREEGPEWHKGKQGTPIMGGIMFIIGVIFAVAVALIGSMTVSGFCGCAVPVLFKKLGIDPAAASGPLITTASDLVSAITYYGIVSLIIGYFLI
mgnify:CR=1 FL=1